MSKIGRLPINLPSGVQLSQDSGVVTITGPKGALTFTLPKGIIVQVEGDQVIVSKVHAEDVSVTAAFGLARAMLNNMVKGVSQGVEKKLELVGVGYRASATPQELTLSLGFSHPVKIKAPQGVSFSVVEGVIVVSGIDITLVGNVAAQIRAIKQPEPYKGKGIKYTTERIRRKAGKAAKAGAAGGK